MVNKQVYCAKDLVYFNQIGWFSHISSNGNQYIMVICKSGNNYIDYKKLQDWATEMIKAYQIWWKRLMVSGVAEPTEYILNN